MTKLCIGLLSYCNSSTHPERFKIFKECLKSLELIASDEIFIYALDNGSSQDVVDLLEKSPYISEVYRASENLFDNLAVHLLAKKANELKAKYVMHLEDDFLFYDNRNFLNSCIEILEINKDICGYIRILKYDYENKDMYDKLSNHPNKDMANFQRHFNNISKNNLIWSEKNPWGNFDFYLTNWHWYNFPNICRTDVFEKIIPKSDCFPLQYLEGEMMKNYHNLNLMTGVMDMGVVSHMANYTPEASVRISNKAPGKTPENQFPIVEIEKVNREVERLLCNQKK